MKYLVIVFVLVSWVAQAQYVYDLGGRQIGRVDDVYYYDGYGNMLGRVGQGYVYGSYGAIVGKLEADRLYDAQGYEVRGRVEGGYFYQNGKMVARFTGLTRTQAMIFFLLIGKL
jgi:hypothetical protein